MIPPGAPPDGDWVLDGFVSALYGDVRDPARPAAELAITFYLTAQRRRSARRRSGRASTSAGSPVAGTAPEGYARALSAALGEILGGTRARPGGRGSARGATRAGDVAGARGQNSGGGSASSRGRDAPIR